VLIEADEPRSHEAHEAVRVVEGLFRGSGVSPERFQEKPLLGRDAQATGQTLRVLRDFVV